MEEKKRLEEEEKRKAEMEMQRRKSLIKTEQNKRVGSRLQVHI